MPMMVILTSYVYLEYFRSCFLLLSVVVLMSTFKTVLFILKK